MMNIEREHACDDFALRACGRPSSYAKEMLHVATRYSGANSIGAAPALAMAHRSSLEGRVCAILDSSRSRRPVTRRSGFCTVGVAVTFLLPLAALGSPMGFNVPMALHRSRGEDAPEGQKRGINQSYSPLYGPLPALRATPISKWGHGAIESHWGPQGLSRLAAGEGNTPVSVEPSKTCG